MNNTAFATTPLVSIVIPVFNSEKYLAECLDSILNQTCRDFEIICIDDGSTDSSLNILNDYSIKDSRIKVLTQTNQYAGVARNKGVETATGKYVYFMDSDDFIKPDLLEITTRRAEETSADIVVFGGDIYNTLTGESKCSTSFLYTKFIENLNVFSYRDMPNQILYFSNPAPWTKLYRKEFIIDNNLRFQPLPHANDMYFTKLAFVLAERIACVNASLCCYRISTGTNTQSKKFTDPFRFMDALNALRKELVNRQLFDDLEGSFSDLLLGCLGYEMRPYQNRSDRIDVYRRVLSDSMTVAALNRDRDLYYYKKDYDYLKGLITALETHDTFSLRRDPHADLIYQSEEQESNPLFSIIIPAYNTEQFICDCLNSISKQSFTNYEAIIINDGSTDGTLSVVKEYAGKHSRIKVYNEEHSGVSDARNNGIKVAIGRYLVFVDSDDILADYALAAMADAFGNSDLLCFNLEAFTDTSDDIENANPYEKKVAEYNNYYKKNGTYSKSAYSGPELLDLFVRNDDYTSSVASKAIRRDFFIDNSLWFIPGILHEDEFFTFAAMLLASKVSFCDKTLYLRRIRPQSTVTAVTSFRHDLGYFISYIKMQALYYDNRNQHNWQDYHSSISSTMRTVLTSARLDYKKLSASEKLFRLGLDDKELTLFEGLISDYVDKLNLYESQKKKVKKMEKEISELTEIKEKTHDELIKVRSSNSFRIGKTITWLPRKMKKL